jgi:hypothetical protein
MTTSLPRPPRTTPAADSSAAVDQFIARLQHPHKAAIELLRQIICGVDPAIAEGIKGNAPSFRTVDYFATTQLRAAEGLGLILHLSKKVRERPAFQVDDPKGLIKWLAKDRAIARFSGLEDLAALRPALEDIVRQWIQRG